MAKAISVLLNIMFNLILVIMVLLSIFAETPLLHDSQITPKRLYVIGCIGLAGIVYGFSMLSRSEVTINSRLFILNIVFLCSIQAAYGLINHYSDPVTGKTISMGSFDNVAGFTSCLCFTFPFMLLCLSKKKVIALAIGLLCFSLAVAALIISKYRTAWVCTFSVLLIFAFRQIKDKLKSFPVKALIVGVGLFMVCMIPFGKAIVNQYPDSVKGRILIWKVSSEMVRDCPLTGHGHNAMRREYMNYQMNFFKRDYNSKFAYLAQDVRHPFNEYVNILVSYGICGLLGVMAFFVAVFCLYRKNNCAESFAAFSSILAVALFSITSYPLFYPYTYLILAFDAVVLVKNANNKLPCPLRRATIATGFVLIGISSFLLVHTLSTLQAEREWRKLSEERELYNSESAMDGYSRLMGQLNDNPYFLYNYAAELYWSKKYASSLRTANMCRDLLSSYDLSMLLGAVYVELGKLDNGLAYYSEAHYMCPNKFEPLRQMMSIYNKMNNRSSAIKTARQILAMKVKIPSSETKSIKEEAYNIINMK